MKSKFFNDAIIGGNNITASYTNKGELLRVMYPAPDYRNWIEEFSTGVKINDSNIVYLHKDINNKYNQYYTENTNILNTEILNTYFNFKIKQTDFVLTKENVLVKKYEFENKNNIELDVNFLIHTKLFSDMNNMVGSEIKEDCLIQYSHDYTMYTFANNNIDSYQLNDTKENISTGVIKDKDYIGMSSDSSINFKIGKIKPKEKKELVVYIIFLKNEENNSDIIKKIEDIRKTDISKEEQHVEKYWKKYVKEHINNQVLKLATSEFNRKFNKIYIRTILLFPLLINNETGGISASVEIDEEMKECGRYNFCWTRDAVFITKALDILNKQKETEKFYKTFCKKTQSKNGMWEQRFYTDGRLAPCWGYQIDETASVIFGLYEHYKVTKELKFLKDTYKMCEKATKFLLRYLDNILGIKDKSDFVKNEIEEAFKTQERNKLPVSYDLWEMNEGVHLYSLASIYAAFTAMKEIQELLKPEYEQNNRLKVEAINKLEAQIIQYQEKIKKYILDNLYDENTKTFLRNLKDKNTDISQLGIVYPFNMFSPKEKKVLNTISKIELTLRTYTGRISKI